MARPREFDEDTVLDAAMQCFWAGGFEATSTRDLAERMRMTPASIYNAFGDKRALFRRALDHYIAQTLHKRIARVEGCPSPGAAITQFFSDVVERSLDDPQRRGCLLVNSTVEASHDTEMREALAGELDQYEAFFRRILAAAQAAGEATTAVSAEDGARQLLTTVLGIRVLCRVRPDRDLLAGAANAALTLLGLPPLPAAGTAPE